MINTGRRLALATGVSSRIGFEFARLCALDGFDLIIAANEPAIFDTAQDLAGGGVAVSPMRCDLSTLEGADALRNRRRGRILVTGCLAGLMPRSSPAVYGGAKALLTSFSVALRNEFRNSSVTVTCLMPGAGKTRVAAPAAA